MKTVQATLFVFLLSLSFFRIQAQGCSDAGFCSMGAMKPDQPFNKKIALKLRSMEVSFYKGTTTTTAKIQAINTDFNFSLSKKTSFQFKVPYHMVKGNLGSTGGVGDLSICFTHQIHSRDKFDLNLSIGTKIPTNHSDLADKGKPFPMYYQNSLGTYDFITGLSIISRNWLVATGIQAPVVHQNKNKFTDDSDWPDYPSPSYIRSHGPAYNLKRGIDVMFRIERNFRFSRLNFSLGLLPIYRITPDRIDVFNESTEQFEEAVVDNTTGLALSSIVTAGYSFNTKSGIKLLLGNRILHREVNPDGLTREMVTSVGYYYRF